MNDKAHSAASEALALIEAFLVATPQPTSEQWREFTLAHPEHAIQIADTSLMLYADDGDAINPEIDFDIELFNATRSAMLNVMHSNTSSFDGAKTALKQCKGPAARNFARQIGLGEHVDLFNQMVSGEVYAPYVLLKRLAKSLQIGLTSMAEIFALNFQNQQAQAFKADGKPVLHRQPVSWEQAVKAAGISGEEASRLLLLEKEME